ncbi:DNA topoisomerase 1 [Rhodotorula paludigena]|uniref:DNA topoisomerase 1 n=1 Tax=Rhodotorula paludigena TaxID=86838 RepID=UPI00317DED27
MSAKPYKKRVIQQDSDESDDDQPLIKRVKPEDAAAADSPVAASAVAVPNGDAPSGQVDTVMNDATAVALDPKAKQLAVFTTGDSDDSDDDMPLAAVAKQGAAGVAHTTGEPSPAPVAGAAGGDSSDDEPLAKKAPAKPKKAAANGNGKAKKGASASSSEDEKPLAKTTAAAKRGPRASTSRKSMKEESDEDDSPLSDADDGEDDYSSGSDAPKRKPKKAASSSGKGKAKAKPAPAKKAPAARRVKKEEDDAEGSASPAPSSTKAASASKGKGKAKKEEDEEGAEGSGDETYKWWENQQDGEQKWRTLEHSGVLFPPEYEPHGVQMKYNGKPVALPPEAEEVASFFAAILETDYVKNKTFVQNFFNDWQKVLKEHPPLDGTKIKDYDKCDFTPIFAYLEAEKAKKKGMTAAQKKAAKAEKDEFEEKYKTCLLDGRKEKVGNFRIEPPGLFRGRGEHPKTGMLKTRVRPEQITINIGKGVPVPQPPKGHKWKSVVHDDKVTWLATWKENINGNVKYVFLAAGSSLKGQSDLKKFEKARALKEHVDRIRADYTADLKSKEMATRQRAVAIYLIDRFALRAGNEKGEDEADTVGCCSLRFEHVTLTPPNKVTFDFLGKDSIRYVNEVEVDEQVFKNLKIFKKEPKTVGDLLFDRLSTQVVNKYLTSYMDGLTAKVFRTYNASWTFAQQLKDTPKDVPLADKLLAYNRANRLVAVLCNHQRSVSKGHMAAMEKLTDKIRALKYQRMKLRKQLFAVADKPKKYKEEYGDDESDLDDDWIVEHEAALVDLEREKIRKKFDKENQKRATEGEKPLAQKELDERLKAADDLEKQIRRDRKSGYEDTKLGEDKLYANLQKMDDRIKVAKTNATDKDEGKEISLGTSKINYIDPRISVAWCKANDVPLNKVLTKTLLEKFQWATHVEADFEW